MKKFISLTLITIMILAATVLPIFAAETDEFTREEAEQLFKDAYNCYVVLQQSWFAHTTVNANMEIITDEKIEIQYILDGREYKKSAVRVDKIVVNEREYVIDSLNDINALVGTYYTSEYIELLTEGTVFYKGMDLFYEGSDGKVYCIWDLWDNNIVYFFDVNDKPLEFGSLTVNGDKATLETNIRIQEGGTLKLNAYFAKIPVEFTKTTDGWRLSDERIISIFTHQTSYMPYVYKHLIYNPETNIYTEVPLNPNTGDTTATTAALLATIALAAVITPFALSKKRRAR